MTSREFLIKLAKKTGRSGKEVSRLLEALKIVISDASVNNCEVVIPQFGTFYSETTDEVIKTDKISGKHILIPPVTEIKFSAAQSLLTKLKEN